MHFILLALTVLTVEASLQINNFQQFKEKFGKKYTNLKEEQYREAVFNKNVELIDNFNSESNDVELGINEMTDLSIEEYKSLYQNGILEESLTKFAQNENVRENKPDVDVSKLPATVDWRPMGNKIRTQGHCGSCWAFATLATIEYALAIHKDIHSGYLSVQELIDCASNARYANNGCTYGIADQAYDYVVDNGVYKDLYYSYHFKDQKCQNDTKILSHQHKYNISGYEIIDSHANDSAFMDVLAHVGPVTAAIKVDDVIFKHYKTGIIKNLNNGAIFVNHIIAIVGYTTVNETDVWIVRNSWGEHWGDKGYGYIERGYNQMGINNYGIYPLV